MCSRLAAALDGARFVRYDSRGYVFASFGGHGLHVYDVGGHELDYASTGDFAVASASEAELVAAVDLWPSDVPAGRHIAQAEEDATFYFDDLEDDA